MMIRDARLEDVVEIVGLLEKFHEEGHQKILTINYERGIELIHSYILDEDSRLRLLIVDGKIVGLHCMHRSHEWAEEYLGYLTWFYVDPDYRKSRIALQLALDMVLQQDDLEIKIMYATSTAGMGKVNEAAFKKLLKRVGFTDEFGCLTRIP